MLENGLYIACLNIPAGNFHIFFYAAAKHQCHNPRQSLCILHHDKPYRRGMYYYTHACMYIIFVQKLHDMHKHFHMQAEEIMKKIEKEEVSLSEQSGTPESQTYNI